MYKNTPKSTAIGTNLNKGAMITEQPTITDTNKELTLCSKLIKYKYNILSNITL